LDFWCGAAGVESAKFQAILRGSSDFFAKIIDRWQTLGSRFWDGEIHRLTPGEMTWSPMVEIIETSFGLRKIGEKPGEIPILHLFLQLDTPVFDGEISWRWEKHQFASHLG
jgi:hypothetical protein